MSLAVVADADQRAIEALMNQLALFADQHDAASLCSLFLPEGQFGTAQQVQRGQAALLAEFQLRIGKLDRSTRHVWSNLRIMEASATQIRSAAVQQTYEQDPGKPAIIKVSDLADTYRRNAAGQWRFFERLLERKMVITSAP